MKQTLVKKNGQAVLSFEISGMTRLGKKVSVSLDVKIEVMKPTDVERLLEPDVCLPHHLHVNFTLTSFPHSKTHILLPSLQKLCCVFDCLTLWSIVNWKAPTMVWNPVIFGPGGYIHTVSNSTQSTTECFPPSLTKLWWVLSQQSQTPLWSPLLLSSQASKACCMISIDPTRTVWWMLRLRRKRYRSMGAARKEGWKLPSVFSFLLFSVLQSLRFTLNT